MHLSRITQCSIRLKPKPFYKFYSSTTTESPLVHDQPKNNLEHLQNRSLIKLDGPDASGLLQGLITNDIYHLPQETGKLSSIYAMFLNSKGRIICDSLIYSIGDKDSYIVEADSQIIDKLMKHLKMYKLKKKVDIDLLDSYKVFALYDPKDDKGPVPKLLECSRESSSSATNGTVLKDKYLFSDPRVPALGCRLLTKNIETIPPELCVSNVNPTTGANFRWLRYTLGVGEGIIDIPPQICFPLEHNCDYMNGLNLHKGCYLGQELTARTYHTGKIRKRLMPLFLKKELNQPPSDLSLYDDKKQSLGKLRGVQFNAALALLRMHLVVDIEISVGETHATTKIPHWWPGFKTAKLKDEIADKSC